MPLTKQPVEINFSQGLETKTDPFQVPIGKFLALENSVFDEGGLLKKRNGYGSLAQLPSTDATFLSTFNGNLTAIGTSLQAYNQGSKTWVDKGSIQPISLDVLPLIRNNTNQVQSDTAVSSNGLVCTVYTDLVPSMGSNVATYKYAIADATTGQNIVAPTAIPVGSGVVAGSPRVFVLGVYFIIVITNNVSGTYHLQYLAINTTTPTITGVATDVSTAYTPHSTVAFDGVVANNRLYLAWNANTGGGAIKMTSLTTSLGQSNTVTFAGKIATIMSVTADNSNSTPVIYASFYNTGTNNTYTLAVDQLLNTVLAPTLINNTLQFNNLTSIADNGVCTVYAEVNHQYSYTAVNTNYIQKITVTQGGSVGSPTVVARSLGLASKAFVVDSTTYMLSVQDSTFQPTIFLINAAGQVLARVAYGNSGGYITLGLPNVTVTDTIAQVSYLFKDLVQAVNKTQGVANAAGVYAQTGINMVSFDVGHDVKTSAEIGNNLHLTGGFLWMYDGYSPVENNFFLWPEDIGATWSATGGSMVAKPDSITNTNAYFYVVTYEWSDNQGNLFKSAPSVPLGVTTTGALSTGSVALNIPTLRLTYKTANPVKIVVYRWSVGQQTYYQVTSILVPVLNDTTVDSIAYTDTSADSSIVGNNILYTTGGVLEDIGAPPVETMTLWQDRLVLLDAEDKNLLWYSKQVIESTPVELNDSLTLFVAPTIGSQGSTGPITSLAAMDEKLIVFKENAIYYFNGAGPDNTGANSQISDPVFITSTVGCANQASIVFMPSGLMFQSDKGIWLLGRDLSTSYIGAPVEGYTKNATIQSAVSVPKTNQVRFTLDTGRTLMYDYYYGQWGTFVNVPAVSSTLYQGLHTYLNSVGSVFQETPGIYLDASNPVLMSFTTSWIKLAGLQGFQRAYEMYFLATYLSPHRLSVQIGYDYNPSPSQATTITPDNFALPYGGEQLWGSAGPWGGPGNIEQWRIFFDRQKCESFQITVKEMFDPSFGTTAGAGLTMSGMNLTVGLKDSKPRLRGARQTG